MDSTWIATTVLALLAGAGVGVWFGRRTAARSLGTRARHAERELQNQQTRAAEALRAAQSRAAKELGDARSEWKTRAQAASAAHRAEVDKLTQHLTEACDELDRLRVRAGSAERSPGLDTGQGFAATMPLGDL